MSEEGGPEGDDAPTRPDAVDVDDDAAAPAPLPVVFPEDEGSDELPPPSPDPGPPPPPPHGAVATRDARPVLLVFGAVVAVVVIAVLVIALVRTLAGDDDGDADSVPTGPLGAIVPDIAASPVMLGPEDRAALLDEVLTTGRNDVATDVPTGVLCAAVALDTTIEAVGRWERDGREIVRRDPSSVGPPGFGDCIDAGGNRMEDGTYQFLVTDPDGAESAAGTLVLGAAPIAQPFVNDGTEPICQLRIAPTRAGYFEAYDLTATPVPPGGTIALVIADVEQAVRTTGCAEAGGDPGDAPDLASFEFDPDPTDVRPLSP